MAIEERWWKVKKSMYSPTDVSKRKTLHELGPPQGCSATLLPSLSIARDPSEAVRATQAKCIGYVCSSTAEEKQKGSPRASPRSTFCLPPRCKEVEQTSKQRCST